MGVFFMFRGGAGGAPEGGEEGGEEGAAPPPAADAPGEDMETAD
jgi:hypothetical protein